MKSLLSLCLILSLASAAYAENNGLVVDAEARGYAIKIQDVVFGNSGLTMFKPGVRVSIKNILKNGKAIPAAALNGPDADRKMMEQANQLCIDMFSTPDRVQNFEISGIGYWAQTNVNSIECLFSNR